MAEMRIDAIKTPHVDCIRIAGSASTHNCGLRTLRRMLNIAIELDLISKVPKFGLREERKRTELIEPATEEKIASVLGSSKHKGALKTALYLILDAGMRPNEGTQRPLT
jgi:hypothetical protein